MRISDCTSILAYELTEVRKELTESARITVRRQPLLSVGLVFLAGMLIGQLRRRTV